MTSLGWAQIQYDQVSLSQGENLDRHVMWRRVLCCHGPRTYHPVPDPSLLPQREHGPSQHARQHIFLTNLESRATVAGWLFHLPLPLPPSTAVKCTVLKLKSKQPWETYNTPPPFLGKRGVWSRQRPISSLWSRKPNAGGMRKLPPVVRQAGILSMAFK